MGRLFFFLLLVVILSSANNWKNILYANDNAPLDQEEKSDSFSDEDFGTEEIDGAENEEIKLDLNILQNTKRDQNATFSLGGFIKEDLGYSYSYSSSNPAPYDKPAFSKIRTTLNLKTDYKLTPDWRVTLVGNGYYDYAYLRRGRDKFTDEVLKSMEEELEVRDFFIEGALFPRLRLKLGRQIIAWGESDTAQITDMANPKDIREIGMVDREDAKIPVTATKLTTLINSLEINLVAIHEFRPNRIAAKGSEFDLLSKVTPVLAKLGGVLRDEEVTEYQETEYLFRLYKNFNGGDLSFVWADTYDDQLYLDSEPGSFDLTPKHNRIKSIGASGNKVLGTWLLKAEIGKKIGQTFPLKSTNLIINLKTGKEIWVRKNKLEWMLGADYSGISNLKITTEVTGEEIQEYEDDLNSPKTKTGYSLRLAHSAMNDKVNSTLFWVHYSSGNGDIVRADLRYDILDALQLTVGAINYMAAKTEATLYPIRNSDRLLMSAKYSF
jgi:hypothetical protein